MEQFNRFYLWGVNTKYRMGLYFSAAVFCKGLVSALLGRWTLETLTLLEMLLACFAFACLETALFPCRREQEPAGDSSPGAQAASSFALLEMLLTCLVFTGLEGALSSAEQPRPDRNAWKRATLWAVAANVIFIGCAWGLGWFPDIPLWGGLLLVLFLEYGLAAMWYALRLREKRDTAALNQGLRRFQEEENFSSPH